MYIVNWIGYLAYCTIFLHVWPHQIKIKLTQATTTKAMVECVKIQTYKSKSLEFMTWTKLFVCGNYERNKWTTFFFRGRNTEIRRKHSSFKRECIRWFTMILCMTVVVLLLILRCLPGRCFYLPRDRPVKKEIEKSEK